MSTFYVTRSSIFPTVFLCVVRNLRKIKKKKKPIVQLNIGFLLLLISKIITENACNFYRIIEMATIFRFVRLRVNNILWKVYHTIF